MKSNKKSRLIVLLILLIITLSFAVWWIKFGGQKLVINKIYKNDDVFVQPSDQIIKNNDGDIRIDDTDVPLKIKKIDSN